MRRCFASPRSNPEATGQYKPQFEQRTAGTGLLDEYSTAVLAAVIVAIEERMMHEGGNEGRFNSRKVSRRRSGDQVH
jgi:hypothetical protein